MREINYSVPGSNKAAVGITTALYDRRALDCTSTLPLINSLNHLAYLTTSSARIREILTIDGGIEKLVSILKNGRSKDMMEIWKWNLAFQCVVNVGVRGSDGRTSDNRGSENIRTRVVEADVVPVVATILDNYIQVVEKLRRPDEAAQRNSNIRMGPSSRRVRFSEERGSSRSDRRREAPPPINIPTPEEQAPIDSESDPMEISTGEGVVEVPPEATSFPTEQAQVEFHVGRQHSRSQGSRIDVSETPSPPRARSPRSDSTRARASTWTASDPSLLRPRDSQVMPSAARQTDSFGQPDTPTTPTGPATTTAESQSSSRRTSASPAGPRRRLSIRHQLSISESPGQHRNAEIVVEQAIGRAREEPMIGMENDMNMADMAERAAVLETAEQVEPFPGNLPGNSEVDFNNLAQATLDGSIVDPSATPTQRTVGFPANQQQFPNIEPTPELIAPGLLARFSQDIGRTGSPNIMASVPRDEDVLMSLQLLAYVSKYCNLRSYFQQSHLVPKLKIGSELLQVDGQAPSLEDLETEVDNDEEYCQPDNFNIFPLVEKFTFRHHSSDMQHWAGVVMRNLCRKDKSRGDIRQCAYYKCGKWEQYARQFAKCRRCRQTKYCSKECQKNAWVAHRHWCVDCKT